MRAWAPPFPGAGDPNEGVSPTIYLPDREPYSDQPLDSGGAAALESVPLTVFPESAKNPTA